MDKLQGAFSLDSPFKSLQSNPLHFALFFFKHQFGYIKGFQRLTAS